MKKSIKIIILMMLVQSLYGHGVSESTVNAMTNASLMDFIYFGGEHMITGYDHILFLIGIVFFLTNYSEF